MVDTITLLQAAEGFSTGKTITSEGVQSYNAGSWFAVEESEIANIHELAGVLEVAGSPEHRLLVIRGQLAPGSPQPVERQKKNFPERPRHWVLLDFDEAEVEDADLVADPEGAVRAVIAQYLPEYFQDVTCFWQLSSRAGLDEGIVKVHLWYWLDRPIGFQEGTEWSEACAPDVDSSLFRTVQPHYIANPIFIGVEDPLPRRTGLLVGSREEVPFPRDWSLFALPAAAARREGGRVPGTTYEEKIALLGDGPGLFGFHAVIRDAIWSYLARGRTDVDWLKVNLRDLVVDAPIGPGRDVFDLERYITDEYLDDSIDGARKKIEKEQGLKLPLDSLQRLAKSLVTKQDERSEIGAALVKACKGEVFADPAVCEYLVPKMAVILAKRFTAFDPDSIADLFGPSLSLMPGLSVSSLAYAIRSEQVVLRSDQNKVDGEKRRRVREAFKNGREHPYTPVELANFPEDIAQRWILQKGSSFYLFVDGGYAGPYTKDDVLNAVVRDLSPAESAGVQLFQVNKQGDVAQKSINQLVQQYGTVVKEVTLNMTLQKTQYDEEMRAVIEAPCPLRKITPTYHAEIDRWFRFLGGEKYEDLKTWCAAILRLESAIPAIFFIGKKGVGKGLFALGVARLWHKGGPTSLVDAFAPFNDAISRCPLCFADETLPKDFRGTSKSGELREHIQATSRPFRRKFLPTATLVGATRTIVAANSDEVLGTQENLTVNDVAAIAERYLHIEVNSDEAATYLLATDTSGWIERDMIAEHVLWLVENHPWKPRGRFLIEVDAKSLQISLAVRDGVKSHVCEWLVGYLLDPQRFDTAGAANMLVRRKDGELLVNVQGISNCWDFYVNNPKFSPPTGALARALAGICKDEGDGDPRLRYKDARGRFVKYRVVDIAYLLAWAKSTGKGDPEEIRNALKISTEETIVRLN